MNKTVKADASQEEIVVEAASPPVQLSTGDFLHLYCGGTTGWVANGNYTCGYVILDGSDKEHKVKERSHAHVLHPDQAWEGVDPTGSWPVNRKRTIFATQIVPVATSVPGQDEFVVWYGAADASVATARMRVTWEDTAALQ